MMPSRDSRSQKLGLLSSRERLRMMRKLDLHLLN